MSKPSPRRPLRGTLVAVVGAAVVAAGTLIAIGGNGFTITPQPDEIALHYKGGPLQGNRFDRVIDPGTQAANLTVADTTVYLPTSLRTWNIAADDGADQRAPIVVPTSDGVLVNVWMQANFVLNSNYEDIEGYDGGTIRKFWEEIGRRYGADTAAGWQQMMLVTVVPALEKAATDTIRAYAADPLVYNTDGLYVAVQEQIGAEFQTNLRRLSGGDYFCGPSFVRGSGQCPAPELILRGIDFANPAIQDARDSRRTEEELARARLVEAEGHLDAQAVMAEALSDPGYLAYLLAQMELEAARACAASADCTYINGTEVSPVVPVG